MIIFKLNFNFIIIFKLNLNVIKIFKLNFITGSRINQLEFEYLKVYTLEHSFWLCGPSDFDFEIQTVGQRWCRVFIFFNDNRLSNVFFLILCGRSDRISLWPVVQKRCDPETRRRM